jgi:hypothetical protein
VRPRHSRTRRAPGFRLRLGVAPTRPVVRNAFAIVCSLRRVALPRPPLFDFLNPVSESKDKEIATDPRRINEVQPSPFETQLRGMAPPGTAVDLALRERHHVRRYAPDRVQAGAIFDREGVGELLGEVGGRQHEPAAAIGVMQ